MASLKNTLRAAQVTKNNTKYYVPGKVLHCFRKILNRENNQQRGMAGRESSGSVPKRRSMSRSGGGNWPAELLLWLAFVYFAATAAFYTGQVVIVRSLHREKWNDSSKCNMSGRVRR